MLGCTDRTCGAVAEGYAAAGLRQKRTGVAAPDKEVPELNNNNRGNNRRRSRGNSRPQGGGGGGQQINRIDSRARGNAPQMLEKYRKLAQDAHLNGDRVQAEYYLQFADHYFRVIADTRLRQEEQRLRQTGGAPGERWQEPEAEDDGTDYSMDNDFPGFDRQQTRREEPRREERDNRGEEGQREEGQRTEGQRSEGRREEGRRDEPRREEGRRDDGRRSDSRRDDGRREDSRREDHRRSDSAREEREPREYRGRRQEPVEPQVEAVPAGEGVRAAEGEPIAEAGDNPFVRDARTMRGLKPRSERRRRDERSEEEAPAFDPSSLPPAFGARREEEAPAASVETSAPVEEAAPAPKRRGRPRKTPPAEAAAAEG